MRIMAATATAGAPAPAGETRRHILAFAGWSTIGLIALQGVVAFLFYFWPRKTGAFGTKLSVGSPEQYKPGEVKYFVEGKFYLVRLSPEDAGAGAGAGGFVALYQKCPHVGCTVPWRAEFQFPYQEQTVTGLFRCPCHGSTYLKNGQIIFGPAPRPMDLMKISLESGTLVVDSGRITKRTAYDPSQVFRV